MLVTPPKSSIPWLCPSAQTIRVGGSGVSITNKNIKVFLKQAIVYHV